MAPQRMAILNWTKIFAEYVPIIRARRNGIPDSISCSNVAKPLIQAAIMPIRRCLGDRMTLAVCTGDSPICELATLASMGYAHQNARCLRFPVPCYVGSQRSVVH